MELAPGRILAGRFVLDRQLGEGGMGLVWAAIHAVTRKAVAIKVLRPERAADPLIRQRFVREARAASVVQHPNIIEIRDVIELEGGAPAIVMDLLEGESLGARLEREAVLDLGTLAPILLQVVSALGTAHAAGVVHRDLKPDNIFLVNGADGPSVRVLDFGIAKVMAMEGGLEISHGLTITGAMLGTPFYMAPEQIYGERDIDQRADIWAIGVIMYECLSGRRPTEAQNLGGILRIITENEIVPLPNLVRGLPDDVLQLVDRMLTRDRAARPRSLIDAFEVLRRYTGSVGASSFGEPAVAAIRNSVPAQTKSPSPVRTLIHVGEGGTGHATTQQSSVTPAGAVVSGARSPRAGTLASTTASTTADELRGLSSRRQRAVALVGGVMVVAAASATAVVVSTRSEVAGVDASATLIALPPSVLPAPSAPPAPPPSVLPPDPSASTAARPAAGEAARQGSPSGEPARQGSPSGSTTASSTRPRSGTTPPPRPVARPAGTKPTDADPNPKSNPNLYDHM